MMIIIIIILIIIIKIIMIIIIILINTLFREATHLTTRQSSMRDSNNRKQLTNKLTNALWMIGFKTHNQEILGQHFSEV